MIETSQEIFVLKVDIVAAGTRLRVGYGLQDFCLVENLSVGDEVFDPIEERLVEITELACVTLDSDTIRDRGFSPKVLARDTAPNPLVYGVKVPVLLARHGYTPPIRGEYKLSEGTVFFALGFERRAIVETPSCLCEFARPSNYTIQNTPQRPASSLRSDMLSQRR